MPIAYIVSAYKLPEQLVRLVARLDSPTATFYIHVDRKTAPADYAAMAGPLAGRPNVRFLPRHVCHWGDFGHVRASLKGLAAMRQQRDPAGYVVLLTGQDYPLQPNHALERFFEQSGGQAFMDIQPLPASRWSNEDGGLDRLRFWHFRLAGRPLAFPAPGMLTGPGVGRLWGGLAPALPRRRLPASVEWHGGSAYWCLPRDCADYVHQFADAQPGFVRFFEHVRIPDEIFFHTVLMNSPLRERIVNTDLRCMRWQREARSPSPDILRASDFDHLAQSGRLFARKFDPSEDSAILDMIDTRLLDRPPGA